MELDVWYRARDELCVRERHIPVRKTVQHQRRAGNLFQRIDWQMGILVQIIPDARLPHAEWQARRGQALEKSQLLGMLSHVQAPLLGLGRIKIVTRIQQRPNQ
jgi:hypothetical protein